MADSFRGIAESLVESCCVAGEFEAIAVRTHYYAPGGRDSNRLEFGIRGGSSLVGLDLCTREVYQEGPVEGPR